MNKSVKRLGGASRIIRKTGITVVAILGIVWNSMPPAQADDLPLLKEMVDFTGEVFAYQYQVPGLVIGVVRNGESYVGGFGERADGTNQAPDGDTLMRIGSITKVFAGDVLAHLTADKKVRLTQPLVKSWPELGTKALPDVKQVRLIDLATHAGGLPREVPHAPGPSNDPYAPITLQAFTDWLQKNPLLFRPGKSVMYSNFGFDLLAHGLSKAANEPYPALVSRYITGPLNMPDTVFDPSASQLQRVMQGHDFEGKRCL
jgi:serine-type D-Ala-D-Ala carboxypeptidase/endopeptidase